jgi:hypothetical protein
MRTRTTNLACLALGLLAALLLGAAPARAQQSQPASPPEKAKEKEKEAKPADKPTLEEALSQALKGNADIRVAEAKVNEAEAELNRTRLLVMQKVVASYSACKAARAKVETFEAQLNHLSSATPGGERARLVGELMAAKAELETAEADMPFLLGKPPRKAEAEAPRQDSEAAVSAGLRFLSRMQTGQDQAAALGLLSLAAAQQVAPVPVAEKVRKALDAPIAVDFKDVPFAEVLEYLQDKAGVVIRDQMTRHYPEGGPKITLKFSEPLPLRAVLQALEDEFDDARSLGLRFVVRDYGLLAIPTGNVPPGSALLDRISERQLAHDPDKNPPADNVEGTVTKVDAKTGLITVNVGSDDGLQKGNTLEVFRLSPAKYLGTVRVIQVTPHEATAQPAAQMQVPTQQGDKVASKLSGP